MTEVAQEKEIKNGNLIPLFSLPAVNASGNISPWDYKQQKNLVLIFFRDPECDACLGFLRELASRYEEYRQLNAEILAIMNTDLRHLSRFQRELQLPFPLLSDRGAAVFDSYAEGRGVADPMFGVFIADRWGALFSKTVDSEMKDLPGETEIRDWLSFIEIQCPECFPPEPWPED